MAQSRIKTFTLIDWFNRVVGNDVVMVYGDTGSGKSTFAQWLAKYYASNGRKVLYIDTERNLLENELQHDNITYKYIAEPTEVKNFINNLPFNTQKPLPRVKNKNMPLAGSYDLYILDSLGFPVYYEFSESNAAERGRLLAIAFRIVSRLKLLAQFNRSLVLVTNQPVSPFGKGTQDVFELSPFGGKSRFGVKEKWVSVIKNRSSNETRCGIYSNISRLFPPKKELFEIVIRTVGYDEYGVPKKHVEIYPYWVKQK